MSEITKRTKNYKEYEVLKEIKTYNVSMPCSKCDGEMKFTGMAYITDPPYNVHKCDKCGYEEEFLGVTYPRKEINDDFEKKLRKQIAYEVEDKMEYMHCCPNERDTYLHIIAPDECSRDNIPHCNTDCYNEKCISYHNGENNKEKAQPLKTFTNMTVPQDMWYAGHCPRCNENLSYHYSAHDPDMKNRKQYCWNCGQLVEFK